MSKVKIVQIHGDRYIDDKGRVWYQIASGTDATNRPTYKWVQLDLPEEPA